MGDQERETAIVESKEGCIQDAITDLILVPVPIILSQ
jgi:hypothetical protein